MLQKTALALLLCFLTSCSCGLRQQQDELAFAELQKITPKKPLIVIDPGHGGEDRGTHSDKPPVYQEKSLALATSKMLSIYLRQLGYQTHLTRSEDVFIPLKERAKIANDLQPKLFVSVHFNSAPSKSAHGIEVFYYQSESDKLRSEQSKKLGGHVLDRLITLTEAKSRGVKHGNLAVIRETRMPAILVEGGFLTNDMERKKVQNPLYLKNLARGIAEGIQNYLNP